jgi:hypothetical protein
MELNGRPPDKPASCAWDDPSGSLRSRSFPPGSSAPESRALVAGGFLSAMVDVSHFFKIIPPSSGHLRPV